MNRTPDKYFKTAPRRSLAENAVRTFFQVAIVWSLFLFLIPALIVYLEDSLGIARYGSDLARVLAVVGFCLAGLGGLSCAWVFVRWGSGTPIPCDETTSLTIIGLYRYVRNPMAILGIAQGLLVALYLGSWLVAIYALMGALVWQVLAKPPEERDLLMRFGDDYEEYRQAVRCWIPTTRPFPRVVLEQRDREK